jgi:serine/threonine-protein kinase
MRGRDPESGEIVEIAERPLPAMEADDVARAQRQLQLIKGFHHPNLVAVEDGFIEGDSYYLVTGKRPPRQLARILKRGPLFEHEALRIARDVALALRYLWKERQLVHRDLKPEHVYVEDDGTARLSGFGIAKSWQSEDSEVTTVGTTVGTPQYMSPEQILAKVELDCRSDMYALGCLLYHMLDGKAPFDGVAPMRIAVKQLDEPHEPIQVHNREISPETVATLDRMLEKSREDRFESWDAVLAELPAAPAVGIGTTAPSRPDELPKTAVDKPKETVALPASEPEPAVEIAEVPPVAVAQEQEPVTFAETSREQPVFETSGVSAGAEVEASPGVPVAEVEPAKKWFWAGMGVLGVAAIIVLVVILGR